MRAQHTRLSVSVATTAVLLVAATAALALAGSAAASHGSGTILVDDDPGSGDFSTIQAAVDHANDGDTIVVADGTYDESVLVDKADLTVEAAAGADPGILNETTAPALAIVADGVTVDGFDISKTDPQSVVEIQADGVTLRNNVVFGMGQDLPRGIDLGTTADAADGVTLADNRFFSLHNGVYVVNTTSLDVTSNAFENIVEGGVTLDSQAAGVTVSDNTATDANGLVFVWDDYFQNAPYQNLSAELTLSDNDLADTDELLVAVETDSDPQTALGGGPGGTLPAGAKVLIPPVTFDGRLDLRAPGITLCATNSDYEGCQPGSGATLTASDRDRFVLLVHDTADGYEVNGLTFQGTSLDGYQLVQVYGTEDGTISQNTFVMDQADNATIQPLELAVTNGTVVTDNTFDMTLRYGGCCHTTAIEAEGSGTQEPLTITDNEITMRNEPADSFSGGSKSSAAIGIYDGPLSGADDGGSGHLIAGNDITAVTYGVSVADARDVEIRRNHISLASGSGSDNSAGINLNPGSGHLVASNTVEGDFTTGLSLEGTKDVTARNETYVGPHWGVTLRLFEHYDEAIRPTGFTIRGSDLGATDIPLSFGTYVENLTADARLNDWGVYDADLVRERVDTLDASDDENNTALVTPFLLEDGSPEPGLVRIAGETPSYLTVSAALDAADAGDTVLVPASADAATPTAWKDAVDVDVADVRLCGAPGGTPACTSDIGSGHQQLSRAEWADAPGLGSGEAALFDNQANDLRSTSYFPPEDAKVEDIDAFAFDYYLQEGSCSDVDLGGLLAIDETPDDGNHDRDRLVTITPDISDECAQGEWFHVDYFDDDTRWNFAGDQTRQEAIDSVNAAYPDGNYEVSAVNVVQTDDVTVGYVDNQLISDVVLGERQDRACWFVAGETCRQETATDRTVVDSTGEDTTVVDVAASGATVEDLTLTWDGNVSESVYGVHVTGADATISGNQIEVPGAFCDADGCSKPFLAGVVADAPATVTDNDIVAEPTDEAVLGTWGVNALTDAHVRVAGNTFSGWGTGVVAWSPDLTVADNRMEGNFRGVHLAGDHVDVTGNDIAGSNAAVYVAGDSAFTPTDIVLRDNDLADNAVSLQLEEDKSGAEIDARINHWGTLGEEIIRSARLDGADDNTVLVEPYEDSQGNLHPPEPTVYCRQEGDLDEVGTVLDLATAVSASVVDRFGCDSEERTAVLHTDLEDYEGATVTQPTRVQAGTVTGDPGAPDDLPRIEASPSQPGLAFEAGSGVAGDLQMPSVARVTVTVPADATGIHLGSSAPFLLVEDTTLRGGSGEGLHAASDEGLLVRDSIFTGLDRAVTIDGADDARIEDSRFEAIGSDLGVGTDEAVAADGTDADPLDGLDISRNTFDLQPASDHARVAVSVEDAEAPEITDNGVRGNAYPGSIGVQVDDTTDAVVEANSITGSNLGIHVHESTDATLRQNSITGPPRSQVGGTSLGISLHDGSGHDLEANTVFGTATGLLVGGTADVSAHGGSYQADQTAVELTAASQPTGFEIHDASLQTGAIGLHLGEDTTGLSVNATCNDWGVYKREAIDAQIQDEGEANAVTFDPWTDPLADLECMALPSAAFNGPDTVTRLDDAAFDDQSKAGDRPIVQRTWAWGDGEQTTTVVRQELVNVTHSYDEVGTFTVTLTVRDAANHTAVATDTVTVDNLAPTLEDVDPISVLHDTEKSLLVNATDPENDEMTLSMAEDHGWVTITKVAPGSWNLSLAPGAPEIGMHDLTLTVTDAPDPAVPDDEAHSDTVATTVDVRNPPPEWTTFPTPDPVKVGETQAVNVTADDADHPITLDAGDLPQNVTFADEGDGNGTVTFEPGHVGEVHTITVNATDGHGATTPEQMTLRGGAAPVVDAPTTTVGVAGDPLVLTVSVDDPDTPASAVDLGATDDPAGATFVDNPDETGTWTWPIPLEREDDASVTFTADDGNFSTAVTTQVTVLQRPAAAELPVEVAGADVRDEDVSPGEDVILRSNVSDDDGVVVDGHYDLATGYEVPASLQGDGTLASDPVRVSRLAEAPDVLLPLDGDGAGGVSLANVANASLSGSCSACPAATGGDLGGAASFDGSDDVVTVGSNDALDVDQDDAYTLSARLKTSSSGFAIAGKMDPDAAHRGFDLYVHSGHLRAHLIHSWSGDAIAVDSVPTIDDGQWHQVAVTYDGSGTAAGMTLYVDGQAVDTTVVQDSLTSTTSTDAPFQVGARDGEALLQGSVDEVFFADRVLSAGEIAERAQRDEAPTARAFPGLGNWTPSAVPVDDDGLEGPTLHGVNVTANEAPSLAAPDQVVVQGLDQVVLDASNSSDPEGRPVDVSWTLPDGTTVDNGVAVWQPSSLGTYQATASVTDNLGATNVSTVTVIVDDELHATPTISPGPDDDPHTVGVDERPLASVMVQSTFGSPTVGAEATFEVVHDATGQVVSSVDATTDDEGVAFARLPYDVQDGLTGEGKNLLGDHTLRVTASFQDQIPGPDAVNGNETVTETFEYVVE